MAYYLGLDIGTSATKALVMDSRGKVLATATDQHDISAPQPNWSEQDPGQWYTACVTATGKVIQSASIDGKQILGVGLSGQMHGLVITDETDKLLRPAIIWNDQRTAAETIEIEQTAGGRDRLIELTGNAAMSSFTLTKLLWVRKNEPRVFERIAHMLLPKDYIRLKLTGEYAGDVSDMSGTLMLDQKTRDWSGEILSLFDIDRDILPPVLESHEIAGRLTKSAANQLGLAQGTPVVAGGGDQPAGAIGNGVVRHGMTSAAIGTSGCVYVHCEDYRTDPAGRVNTFCSSVAGQWCMFGCVLSAGGSFQWLRDTLGAEEIAQAREQNCDPYELLTARAATAPASSGGVFFLPYLTGERTPHADPHARGGWFGITSQTTRDELIRAVLEGATFAMADVVKIMRESGLSMRQIRLSGGGARSEFWRQMQADIYGTTCETINCAEGPAYGAALLAAVGAGQFDSVSQACESAIEVTQTITPNADAKRLYAKQHANYARLYPALKDTFAQLAN